MSFAARETSRSLGSPITLFKFAWGGNIYAYCDNDEAVVFNAVTYAPIPIDCDALTSSGSLDKSVTTIRVPYDTAIAEIFRVAPPSDIVAVAIFQGHRAEAEFLAVYSGRVLSSGPADSMAQLRCEPINTSMKRPGLRQRYQYGCPHALYGTTCGASKAAFSNVRSVVSAAGNVVTLTDGWEGAVADVKFVEGLLTWTYGGRTEIRRIHSASAATNQIVIDGLATGLTGGSSVTVSLGCNHQLSDCQAVFANARNFGGCPWIPKKNPIGYGVNQYW